MCACVTFCTFLLENETWKWLCFSCEVWEWLVLTVTPLCPLGRSAAQQSGLVAMWHYRCLWYSHISRVSALILLITLSYVPATGNIVHPGIAVQNDTVELQFNLPTWWLSGVTLDIKNACAGSVFSTKEPLAEHWQQWWNICVKALILTSTCFQP